MLLQSSKDCRRRVRLTKNISLQGKDMDREAQLAKRRQLYLARKGGVLKPPGRPKLYHTEEDRAMARQRYRKRRALRVALGGKSPEIDSQVLDLFAEYLKKLKTSDQVGPLDEFLKQPSSDRAFVEQETSGGVE